MRGRFRALLRVLDRDMRSPLEVSDKRGAECAVRGNYDAARFLIDRGIDMARLDYRWNATAEGWARHAAKDAQMADVLAAAERELRRT
jgi:hypothetical protein